MYARSNKERMTQSGKSSRGSYSIINISSVHKSIPQPQSAHYAGSKEGMVMLTKTFSVDLADKGDQGQWHCP